MTSIFDLYGKTNITTVVGSMPVANPADSLEKKVYEAVESQIKAGIDVISTGQVSMYGKNMIDPFLSTVDNIVYKDLFKKSIFTPEIMPGQFIKLKKDFQSASVIEEIVIAKKYLLKNSIDNIKLKAAVTGPNTILHDIPGHGLGKYTSLKSILKDIGEILVAVIKKMVEAGADTVQIDEPVLALSVYKDVETRIDAIEAITNKVSPQYGCAIHVCGKIDTDLFKLLSMVNNVEILDFEFSLYERNFTTIKPEILRQANKFGTPKNLSIGVVSSVNSMIENVDVVKDRMRDAMKRYGKKNICFAPDCGLRGFTPEVAHAKLKVITQALTELEAERI